MEKGKASTTIPEHGEPQDREDVQAVSAAKPPAVAVIVANPTQPQRSAVSTASKAAKPKLKRPKKGGKSSEDNKHSSSAAKTDATSKRKKKRKKTAQTGLRDVLCGASARHGKRNTVAMVGHHECVRNGQVVFRVLPKPGMKA